MANERALPGLGIKGYADYKSDQWHLWADENWRKLSFLTSGWVKSRTTALPGSGTAGDVYIVKSDAGANANDVAVWDGAAGSEAWVYYTPQEGWQFWVRDEDKVYHFNGTAWVEFTSGATSIDALSDVDTTTSAPTTDQALVWDGTNWVPGDVAAGGGGSGSGRMETIGTVSLSGSTSHEFDLTGYDAAEILLHDVVQDSASTIDAQFSSDGGSTWHTTSGDYKELNTAGATNRTSVLLVGDSNANTENAIMRVSGLSTAAQKSVVAFAAASGTGAIRNSLFTPVEVVNRVRVTVSAGTMTGGTITVRGIKYGGVTLDEGETLITSHDFGATPQSSVDFSMEGYDEVRIIEAGLTGAFRILQLSPDGGSTIRTTGYSRWDSSGAGSTLAGLFVGTASAPADSQFVVRDFARDNTPTNSQNRTGSTSSASIEWARYTTSSEIHNWARYKTNDDTNATAGVVYIIGRKFGVAQRPAVRTVAASENFAAADAGNFVDGDTSGGAVTLTVDDSLFSIGDIIGGGNLGASALTIQFQAGTTINGTDAGSLSPTATTGEYSIRKRATNVWRGSAT